MDNSTEEYRKQISFASEPAQADEFQQMTRPFQHELLVHCYRFFGSLDEAEDALQETWLRAWRRIDTLKDRSALRAWLYRIATNVSLDMLDNHKERLSPEMAYPPADPQEALPPPAHDLAWIDPLPEEYLDWHSLNPEARIELSESVSLAFLTVLQILPGRQRAVLILRDVLGWKAQETAELLDISVPAANSALQRARTTLKNHRRGGSPMRRASSNNQQTETLLKRYVRAWEQADSTGLVSLLREDAVWSMPPLPAWFRGRKAIKEFLEVHLFPGKTPGDLRILPGRANGGPAFAIYQVGDGGRLLPVSFQVLALDNGKVARIDSYLNPDSQLLARFKLPASFDR